MQKEPVFYIDKETNFIVQTIENPENKELSSYCSSFTKLNPNTSEGAAEKHIPVIEVEAGHIIVKVGSIFHPMTAEHSITWVYLLTKAGGQCVYLTPDSEPVAHFKLQEGDEAVAAYAYCNLHGFWKTEIH